MAKPKPLSGFPEWLPAGRLIEQHILQVLQHTFELYGYSSIETRAVEPLSQLLSKGETSKEVYLLSRLQDSAWSGATLPDDAPRAASADRPSADKQLGLHFDLTVPFARYVLENSAQLAFPFKRYQIQKVWRGERPQDGRFREFTQADIDVVGDGDLPYHFEVEAPLVMAHALGELEKIGVPAARILVNNRKLMEGYFLGLGFTDVAVVLRNVDKLDKIGPEKVAELLVSEGGVAPSVAEAALELAQISGGVEVVAQVEALAAKHSIDSDLLREGLGELDQLLRAAAAAGATSVSADLKIARGLDYYTGSVYETVLVGHEQLGSICSGGRYDKLAQDGNRTFPGVGLSIGVSRLVSRLLSAGLVTVSRPVPTVVVVAVDSEETRGGSQAIATGLRARGIPTEVAPAAAKYGKQIRYADRRGIPFVWFPGSDGEPDQLKDIRTGEQVPADRATWQPAAEDLRPQVSPGRADQ